jgi:hypothetical protein
MASVFLLLSNSLVRNVRSGKDSRLSGLDHHWVSVFFFPARESEHHPSLQNEIVVAGIGQNGERRRYGDKREGAAARRVCESFSEDRLMAEIQDF